MKRHRSVKPLLTMAGVAVLGLSGMSCSSNPSKSDSSFVAGGGYTGAGGYTPGAAVDAMVFVKRQHTTVASDGTVSIDVAGGNGQVIDYQRYVPGGGVFLLKPARPDGQLTNLTAQFTTADIAGLDLSFNAQDVVFAMKKSGDDHYHIYTENVASGEIHQKTFGDNDDINPIYVPGDRIVFVTNEAFTEMGTRADEYNHGRVVTQLASVTTSGGDADRKLCSQNLSHTVNPFLRYDGSVGYSRWEHLGGVNDVKLFRMAPDCTQMIHVAGQFGKPSNSLVQVTEISPNTMVGIATNRERTIQAGSLVKIDSQFYDNGVASTQYPRLDSEHVKYDVLTPTVPTGDDPSPAGRYRNPRALPDGRLIVSWADGMVNDTNELSQTPPDFGIYIYDPKANADQPNQLIYNDKQAWDLYAIPLAARNSPPIIGSVQNLTDNSQPGTIGSLDVKNTDLVDNNVNTVQHYAGKDLSMALPAALKEAVKVRVIEGFSTEGAPGVTMFGLTMDEGAAVLGEATVYGDGSWLANVPSYIPMHLQPIDKFGLSIRNQRLWIQSMPGESRVCGGCHESRTGDNSLGINQNPTVASTKGAERFDTTPIAQRQEFPWNKVQTFLTANCVSCHNATQNGSGPQTFYHLTKTDAATGVATTYDIPTLDFSADEIAVYYDRKVQSWAKSYVSIFYPATLDMMTGGFTVTGVVPPKWGVPESARESVLIEKLNVKAADGSYAWDPATHKSHPEDVGVTTVTDADRQMLIKVMDLGGQYYSRQNSTYMPNTTDPTAGKQ